MSAQPAGPGERHEVIHLGGMEAAIVPIDDYLRLRAIERRASPEAREEAGIEASIAAHERWVAAGRPGARSHADVMAELLAPGAGEG